MAQTWIYSISLDRGQVKGQRSMVIMAGRRHVGTGMATLCRA